MGSVVELRWVRRRSVGDKGLEVDVGSESRRPSLPVSAWLPSSCFQKGSLAHLEYHDTATWLYVGKPTNPPSQA
jgi:hypothetical protein